MQKKIIIAITLQVIVIASMLGIISYITINESIDRLLTSRLALARIISNNVEVFINNNLNRLYDISLSGKIDLKDGDLETEKRMLETAYNYSPFTEGVFILDKHGNELLTYPPHVDYFSNLTYITYVNQVLQTGRPVISRPSAAGASAWSITGATSMRSNRRRAPVAISPSLDEWRATSLRSTPYGSRGARGCRSSLRASP